MRLTLDGRGARISVSLRPERPRGFPAAHVAVYPVETEPDMFALVYRLDKERIVSRPPRTGPRAVLYVCHSLIG